MADMARHVRTRIRYDGPALVGHEMDVQDLAPALLAMAEIVQIANRKFNGDTASIKVMVDADVEQQCFQLDLSLVQSFFDHAASFLGTKDVATAKDIAEWIGLIGGAGSGLFAILKKLSHRPDPSSPVTFSVGTQSGTTIINVGGDVGSITVPTPTAKLIADPAVQKAVAGVLRPLDREGYDDLSFIHDDVAVTYIAKDDARRIIASPILPPESAPADGVSHIEGIVRIKSPQYEGAAKWSLLWQGRAIDAEMADEAATWVDAFQHNRISAPPNTVLRVSMTETVKLDFQGAAVGKPSYVVTKVHSTTPPPAQAGFEFG